jgi:hypothetical protein
VHTWIENWLTGRKQKVVLDGEESEWRDVTSGVPQGSVLGPVLFLIFIRDLDRAADDAAKIKKFADDTKVAKKIAGESDKDMLQAVLDKMMDWANRWGMEFNRQKCKVMHFGAGNPKHSYSMGDHVLETTDEEKDVGVIMSSNLKPSSQCARAAKTASVVLGQVSRSFKYRDKRIFPRLYTRYVRPHLEFASPAWNPSYQKDIEVLEKVQQRALKMVSGLTGSTYEEKLKELGMDSLKDRRTEADLVMVYKVLHGLITVDKNAWFTMAARAANVTRSAADELKLIKPFARTDKRSKFFTVRICDAWNSLPKDIRSSRTINQFKSAYRKHKMSNRQWQGAD